jgi:negative regulator of sigma E activity
MMRSESEFDSDCTAEAKRAKRERQKAKMKEERARAAAAAPAAAAAHAQPAHIAPLHSSQLRQQFPWIVTAVAVAVAVLAVIVALVQQRQNAAQSAQVPVLEAVSGRPCRLRLSIRLFAWRRRALSTAEKAARASKTLGAMAVARQHPRRRPSPL